MRRKKGFQDNEWMGTGSGRHRREQRAFFITMGVALLLLAGALLMSASRTSLHLPFRSAAPRE